MISTLALLPEADGLQNLKGVVNEMSLGVVQLLHFFENVYIGTEGSRESHGMCTSRLFGESIERTTPALTATVAMTACALELTQPTIRFPYRPTGYACYPCGFAIVVVNVCRADIDRYALSGNANPATMCVVYMRLWTRGFIKNCYSNCFIGKKSGQE